jgi:hypothetical protein
MLATNPVDVYLQEKIEKLCYNSGWFFEQNKKPTIKENINLDHLTPLLQKYIIQATEVLPKYLSKFNRKMDYIINKKDDKIVVMKLT